MSRIYQFPSSKEYSTFLPLYVHKVCTFVRKSKILHFHFWSRNWNKKFKYEVWTDEKLFIYLSIHLVCIIVFVIWKVEYMYIYIFIYLIIMFLFAPNLFITFIQACLSTKDGQFHVLCSSYTSILFHRSKKLPPVSISIYLSLYSI